MIEGSTVRSHGGAKGMRFCPPSLVRHPLCLPNILGKGGAYSFSHSLPSLTGLVNLLSMFPSDKSLGHFLSPLRASERGPVQTCT